MSLSQVLLYLNRTH